MKAQIGVNNSNSNPDPSAMLDVQSIDKGMLIPRMTHAQRDAIADPVPGLMIYNIEDSCINYFTGENWVKDCAIIDSTISYYPKALGGVNSSETGLDIATDAMGNSYVTGFFYGNSKIGNHEINSSGDADVFVAKLSPSEQVLWAIRGGGPQFDRGYGITVDANGNSYVTGDIEGTVTFGGYTLNSNGSDDIYIVKIDPNGQVLWAKNFGSNGPDIGRSISADASGNTYVTGSFQGSTTFGTTTLSSSGFFDIFVTKIDPNGQVLWALKAGGNSLDTGYGISTDAAGNSYITGSFRNTITFGGFSLTSSGNTDVFVAKVDPSGLVLWAINAGGSNIDVGNDISFDAAGNSYVTGYFRGSGVYGSTVLSNAGQDDALVFKIGSAGQVLWALKAGAGATDRGESITTDAAGNSYVVAEFGGSINFGGSLLTSDGTRDFLVTKIDASGQILWTKQGGGPSSDEGNGVAINSNVGVQVTGAFSNTATLDNFVLNSNGFTDFFVWRLDQDTGESFLGKTLNDFQDGDMDPGNELQTLTFSGSSLNISEGNAVNLSALSDNLGNHIATQILDLNSNDLANADTITANAFIGDGSGLTNVYDNLGNHIATQNFQLSGYWLSHSGANDGLYVASNGNVGIGTSVTNLPLTVKGNAELSGNNNRLRFRSYDGFSSNFIQEGGIRTNFNAPSNLAIFTPSDWRMIFFLPADNGGATTDVLTLQADGHVGIGTPTPDNELHVVGQLKYVDGNQSGGYILTSDTAGVASWQPILKDNLGNHIATQNLELSGNWLSNDGGNEGVFVSSNGNVGIGTDDPGVKLDIAGNTRIATDNAKLTFSSFTSNLGLQNTSEIRTNVNPPNSTSSSSPEDNFMSFRVATNDNGGNTEVMRMQGDGNVGIGTDDPGVKLDIAGNTRIATDNAKLTFSSFTSNLGLQNTSEIRTNVNPPNSTSSSSPKDNFMSFRVATNDNGGNTEVMRMQGDGKVGIGTTSPEMLLHTSSTTASDTTGIKITQSSYNSLFYHNNSGDLVIRKQNKTNQLMIGNNGSIGIGISPTKGKLEIDGSGSSYTVSGQSRYYGSGGSNSNNNYSGTFSIYADGIVGAAAFVAHSDSRIKQVEGVSNSESDLQTLMGIEVTDYRLIDTLAKGNKAVKKVIAQQVAEVYPQAVNTNLTEVVPDIYQRAQVQDGWIMLATDLKAGERIKLITEQRSEVYEVTAVEANRFKVSNLTSDLSPLASLFVFGREVDDFHTVDYEAISMLNVSATQEQQRIIEQQQKMIEQLRRENKTMKASFEARFQALEALLNNPIDSSPVNK